MSSMLLSVCGAVVVFQCLASTSSAATAQQTHFSFTNHLGSLSPYFVPSNTPETLLSGLPPDCVVDKAFLVHRYGSRQPFQAEREDIDELEAFVNTKVGVFQRIEKDLPAAWQFLSHGWNGTYPDSSDLTAIGRHQLFRHGTTIRLQYPHLDLISTTTANTPYIVESAKWFEDGFFGTDMMRPEHVVLDDRDKASSSYITPMTSCEGWTVNLSTANVWRKKYTAKIVERINKVMANATDEIVFEPVHVRGMLNACAFEVAVTGRVSPWCHALVRIDVVNDEYERDLTSQAMFGVGQGNRGIVMGGLLIQKLAEFLRADETGNALALTVGHEWTILLAMTALNLGQEGKNVVDGKISPLRGWQTSRQVPFGAQMLFRRLACGTGETRVQLVLNDANYDLSPAGCDADDYGTCNMEEFLSSESVQRAEKNGVDSPAWEEACRLDAREATTR